MRLLRDALAVLSLLYLVVGYAASQFFVLTGRAEAYATLIDVPPVRMLSLLLLSLAVVLSFLPDRKEHPE